MKSANNSGAGGRRSIPWRSLLKTVLLRRLEGVCPRWVARRQTPGLLCRLEDHIPFLPQRTLLWLAAQLSWRRPLGPYPGWYFSVGDGRPEFGWRLRKIIWQACGQRCADQPIRFRWHDGTKLFLYLGNDMSQPTYVDGCIEPNEFAFLATVLKPGHVFLDIGANDGFFTVFAARRVGQAGRVYAFEPSEREFTRLQANLALNRSRNVRAVRKALAEVNGQAWLKLGERGHEGQNTLGDFAHEVKQAGVQMVDLCRLDDFVRAEGLSRVDVIKMDVEGAEHRVLEGARETLQQFRPILLLELLDQALRFQSSSAAAVVGLLRQAGYTIYDFSPSTGRPVLSEGEAHSDNIVAGPPDLIAITAAAYAKLPVSRAA